MQALEPVRRSVVVPASRERAFQVFTSGMTAWWPASHHIGDAPLEEIVIEPFVGGRWYTRHTDGSETYTGFVRAWEPPARLVLTWQIDPHWRYDPALVTLVEVAFEAVDGGTRVSIEHRDLERFGGDAERMRDLFSGPNAWSGILELYAGAAACAAAP
jgi:uncharacterized protein YndB with AHSA1/START domain